jgi:hypothetical protein
MPAWRNSRTGEVENLPDCCRCGFCCLCETCLAGQVHYGIGKHDPCPGLSFDAGGVSSCALVEVYGAKSMGIMGGCCLLARCYRDGIEYAWAGLPVEVKRRAGENARRGKQAILKGSAA